MKRALVALAGLGLAFGCQQTALSPPAKLLGLRDMVKVGQYIVVTSSEHDELRVLNTVIPIEPGVRGYVGAPNPLQPLAISVVARPTMLATDLRYETSAGGTVPQDIEVTGPYVYAASSGTAEISIVGIGTGTPGPDGGITTPLAPALQLVELKRLLTSAPVTAMAASSEHGSSQLFFATFDGNAGQLNTITLPGPDALVSLTPDVLEGMVHVVFGLGAGETIVDIVTLPGDRLALATRTVTGKGGRAFVYGSTGAITPLLFPSPVRRLSTHAGVDLGYAYPLSDGGSIRPLPAGARIFGVLAEESCPTLQCGLLVAESDTGLLAMDLPGIEARSVDGGALTRDQREMLPMRFGDALVTGISVEPGGAIEFPAANLPPDPVSGLREPNLVTASVLGSVTISTGAIVNFNAGDLTMFDADDTTTDGLPFVSAALITDNAGNVIDSQQGPLIDGGIEFTDGMARDENVIVIFEGKIANLTGLLATGPAGSLTVSGGFESRAQLGDLVTRDDCPTDADGGIYLDDGGVRAFGSITNIVDGGIYFSVTGHDNECKSPPANATTTFSIRAGGDKPFIVEGDTSGYMGRGGETAPMDYVGSYFRHPFGYTPGLHQMLMRFVPGTDGLLAEDRWTLTIEDNFNPLVYTLDPTAAGCAVPVSLLGEIIDDANLQRLFVASPAANGVIDIDPSLAIRGVLYAGMVCYR